MEVFAVVAAALNLQGVGGKLMTLWAIYRHLLQWAKGLWILMCQKYFTFCGITGWYMIFTWSFYLWSDIMLRLLLYIGYTWAIIGDQGVFYLLYNVCCHPGDMFVYWAIDFLLFTNMYWFVCHWRDYIIYCIVENRSNAPWVSKSSPAQYHVITALFIDACYIEQKGYGFIVVSYEYFTFWAILNYVSRLWIGRTGCYLMDFFFDQR